jgi:membrane-associated protease RseP (regulator of RpoE activity)
MVVGMVDWSFDVLRSIAAALVSASAWDTAIVFAIVMVLGLPFLTLVHEVGHALAVRVRGLPLESLAVGDADDLSIRAGGVLLRFGRMLDDDAAAGFVRYDASKASAGDVIVVALAGPFANALAAPALAGAALISGTHGPLDACLWILSVGSVLIAVGNLIPRGTPGTLDHVTDGRITQLAWAARHLPATDLTVAQPRPPTPAPTPHESPERRTGLRWPFATALLLVAVVAFAAGGSTLLVPLLVLFGAACLQGAHRRKAW